MRGILNKKSAVKAADFLKSNKKMAPTGIEPVLPDCHPTGGHPKGEKPGVFKLNKNKWPRRESNPCYQIESLVS